MKYLKYFENNIKISSQTLTTLKNSNIPNILFGNLDCGNNLLHDIIGSPKIIHGSFYCNDNLLESLIGSPEMVYGDFMCHNNYLKNLDGCPKEIYGIFNCCNNNLTSLENCPDLVTKGFFCTNNPWEYLISDNIINKHKITKHIIYSEDNIKKFRSFEYQKDFLTKFPEKYKDLEYFNFAPGIKEEFDWLFNASDMGLM